MIFLVFPLIFGLAGIADTATLSPEMIKKEAREFLLNKLAWDRDQLEVTVNYGGRPLKLPGGRISYEFNLPGNKKRAGRVPFSGLIKVDGKVRHRIRLYADVSVYYEVFQAAKPIRQNHVLTEEDVELVQIKSNRVIRNVATNIKEVVGYKVTRQLEKGQTLYTYMLRREPLIKRGDHITLIARKGALVVTAPGVARENGFRNQTVQVENTQSRKRVFGNVVDAHTVEINF